MSSLNNSANSQTEFVQTGFPLTRHQASQHISQSRVSSLKPVSTQTRSQQLRESQEALGDYVAHLQLHMALQARNLVPHLNQETASHDSRSLMLQKSQADFEKVASRQ
jgi:hypothetical protein